LTIVQAIVDDVLSKLVATKAPLCRVCHRPMDLFWDCSITPWELLVTQPEKWYCESDYQVYFAKEERWEVRQGRTDEILVYHLLEGYERIKNARDDRPPPFLYPGGLIHGRVCPHGIPAEICLVCCPHGIPTETSPVCAQGGPAWEDIRHVIALESGLSTWIKGIVLEVVSKDSKLIVLCETCGSALRVSENEYACETCKQSRSGKFVFTGRVRIDDGTGVADVVFSDIDEQALLALNLAEVKHEMLRNHECQVTLGKEQILAVIGREIEVYGTAKQDANGKFELIAKRALLATVSVPPEDFLSY
jgi:hypothetical protein